MWILIPQFLSNEKDSVRRESSRCLAIATSYGPDDALLQLVNVDLLKKQIDNWREKDGILQGIKLMFSMDLWAQCKLDHIAIHTME